MAENTGDRSDLIRSLPEEPEPGESLGKQAALAVAEAKRADKIDPEVQQSALEWLLSDEDADSGGFEKVEIDVAPVGKDSKWVTWVLRPINAEELKAARRMARQGNRSQRRARLTDEDADLTEINVRIVAMATVDPDLVAAAQRKGIADPAFVLKHRFQFKPGLIDQLAAKVLTISGYEEDAMRDPIEVRVAGS